MYMNWFLRIEWRKGHPSKMPRTVLIELRSKVSNDDNFPLTLKKDQ